MTPMLPLFGVIWTTFIVVGLLGDVFWYLDVLPAPRIFFGVMIIAFAVVETWGGLRVARGDMLSEKIWWWVGKKEPWRSVASGLFAIWLSMHVYLVLGPGDVSVAIGIVLCSWLSMHFHARGV